MERTRNETNLGTIGWAVTLIGAALWDVCAEESLTHAFRRGLENRHTRPIVLGSLALINAHLLHVIPERIDPFCIAEKFLNE